MGIKNWKYNKDIQTQSFEPVPVGKYRCRIESAEETVSKSGKDMIEVTLMISSGRTLKHYIVFMPEGVDKNGNPLSDITDRNLKELYTAFGIEEGNLNPASWVGKVGGVKVKHEADQNGEMRARIHYFLDQNQTNLLPAWGQKESSPSVASIKDADGWE